MAGVPAGEFAEVAILQGMAMNFHPIWNFHALPTYFSQRHVQSAPQGRHPTSVGQLND